MYKLYFILLLFPLNVLSAETNFWELTNGPYAGTIRDYSIDSLGEIYGGTGNGVFKSTDNGINWSYAGLQGKEVYSICKSSTGVILAGSYNEGLYRSTNGGLNWQTANLGISYIPDLFEIQNGILVAATIQGVFRSIDGGLNWNLTLQDVAGFSIAKSSVDGDVFVSCYNGLYRSSDSAKSWTRIESMTDINLRSVNISNNGYIFVAGWDSHISRSTNNGKSFSVLYLDSIYDPLCVTSSPNGLVYCGTGYDGVWRSTNYGDTWVKLNYGSGIFNMITGFNNEIFASIWGRGSVKTTDNGLSWIQSTNGIVNSFVNSIIKTLNGKIISSYGQISTDNGMNWFTADNPIVAYKLAINNTNGFIYAVTGSNGIYRSTDNGDNWNFINVHSLSYGLVTLTVHKNGNVYAGGGGGGMYKSTNDGVNWVQFTSGTFSSIARNSLNHYFAGGLNGIYKSTNEGQNWSIVLTLSNNTGYYFNPVIVTGDDIIYAGGTSGIYRSTNDGNNWISEGGIGKISHIIETENGKLFATCYDYINVNNGGVFKKEGNSWENITYDLVNKNVVSVCFNSIGQLLVGTSGCGVSRSITKVIGVNNLSTTQIVDYKLFQNYPNPFNPVTNIKFELPSDNFVTIIIYDQSGKEVFVLLSEFKNSGKHSVSFNGMNFSSGVYYYSIKAGNFVRTKSMILIK